MICSEARSGVAGGPPIAARRGLRRGWRGHAVCVNLSMHSTCGGGLALLRTGLPGQKWRRRGPRTRSCGTCPCSNSADLQAPWRHGRGGGGIDVRLRACSSHVLV